MQLQSLSVEILIASKMGLTATAVYSLAAYVANLIEIPQRSITSIFNRCFIKEHGRIKNYAEINRVYHRSSINMLLLALFYFWKRLA
jgi:hypothetical protein